MKFPLSKTQQKYFDFIKQYYEDYKTAPTCEEIKQGLNLISKSNVFASINILHKKGWITKLPGTWRGIVIND